VSGLPEKTEARQRLVRETVLEPVAEDAWPVAAASPNTSPAYSPCLTRRHPPGHDLNNSLTRWSSLG
jgi:hypothetical protein